MMKISVGRAAVNLWRWLREWFTLRVAEQHVTHLSDAERIEIRAEVRFAVALMLEADRAADLSVRTQLAHQSLERLVVAAAASSSTSSSDGPIDWPSVEAAIAIVSAMPELAAHVSTLAFLRAEAPFAQLADRQYTLLADAFAAIERRVDVRTTRDFLTTRVLRAVAVFGVLLFGAWAVFSPSNLARGKVVTASSVCKDAMSPLLGEPRLSRTVDGSHAEPTLAICTNLESQPWITVDLGRVRSVQEIVIYGRNDGNWSVGAGPMQLRVSRDDVSFQTVAVRTTPVLRGQPWRAKFNTRPARFVRIEGTSETPQLLVATEVEIYGR